VGAIDEVGADIGQRLALLRDRRRRWCARARARVEAGIQRPKPKFGVALQFRAGLDAGPVAVSACGDAKRQVGYFLAAFRWARGKASHAPSARG
jgi:hypothetical protein